MKLAEGSGDIDWEWIDALNAFPEQTKDQHFKINADRMEERVVGRWRNTPFGQLAK